MISDACALPVLRKIGALAEASGTIFCLEANATGYGCDFMTVLAEAGRVDVLVNVAGGFSMSTAVHETELATWDFLLNLNAKSILLTSKAFVPQMIARGAGKIISVAARAP